MATDQRIIVPTAGTPFVASPSDNKVVQPGAGALSLTGAAPIASLPGSYAPLRTAYFLDGPDEAVAVDIADPDNLDYSDVASRQVYDDDGPAPVVGNYCLRSSTQTGNTSFGGQIIREDNGVDSIIVSQGGEMWIRFYYYIPSTFVYNGTPGFTKFMRLNVVAGDGRGNAGQLDLVMRNGTGPQQMQMQFDEVRSLSSQTINGTGTFKDQPTPQSFPADQWNYLDWYIYASSDAEQGIMRLYFNGILQLDYSQADDGDAGTITLGHPNDTLRQIRYGDFWNGGAPSNDSIWIDAIAVATDANPPTQIGSDGNLIIGSDLST